MNCRRVGNRGLSAAVMIMTCSTYTQVCNIDRVRADTITKEAFERLYEGKRPVIITNITTPDADAVREAKAKRAVIIFRVGSSLS